jgi:hypothetical protein
MMIDSITSAIQHLQSRFPEVEFNCTFTRALKMETAFKYWDNDEFIRLTKKQRKIIQHWILLLGEKK